MRATMSQTKTTRAFRTISEAGEELGLQPHVLRFWESKFSHIKPIKRGGGRRFYRPEDIEFIRGIKKLLHDENHPIKDVQKLIQKKGASRVVELGRSVEKAALEKTVAETDLLPKRIKPADTATVPSPAAQPKRVERKSKIAPQAVMPAAVPPPPIPMPDPTPTGPSAADILALEEALKALEALKLKMSDFRKAGVRD